MTAHTAAIIGLTGGIACGKSVISAYLQEKGIPVIDGDVVARQIVEPGTKGLAQIVEGLPAKFVIEKWKGTPCMFKPTSCPDQFAITIEECLAKMEAEKANA